ncbi:MAG: hypothetical protein IMZ58_08220 [Thermoplasmata archaeon]|nr:hypothetical protein [Thermoplasmata archaeon]
MRALTLFIAILLSCSMTSPLEHTTIIVSSAYYPVPSSWSDSIQIWVDGSYSHSFSCRGSFNSTVDTFKAYPGSTCDAVYVISGNRQSNTLTVSRDSTIRWLIGK